MKLILIHGPPASGKFTVAKELAKITKYKLVHIHDFYDPLAEIFTEEHYYEIIEILEKHFLNIFENASKLKIKGLIFTYTEMARNKFRFIKKIKKLFKKYGGRLVFVHLSCHEKELYKRVINKSRKKYWKTKTKKDMEWMLKNKNYEKTFEGATILKIDNTKIPAKKVAQQIKKYFKIK